MLIIIGCVFGILSGLSLIALFFCIFYYNLLVGGIMRTLHLRWRLKLFMRKTLSEFINEYKIGTKFKGILIEDSIVKLSPIGTKIAFYLWGMDIFIGKIPMIKLMIFCNIIMWIIK